MVNGIFSMIYCPKHFNYKVFNLPTIKGKPLIIQQLFQNLITNAIKYNDKETGLLEIGYEDSYEHNKFYVKDNGIGIEKEVP